LTLVVGLSSAASLKLAYTEEDQQKSRLFPKRIVFCGSNLQGHTLHGHLKSGKTYFGLMRVSLTCTLMTVKGTFGVQLISVTTNGTQQQQSSLEVVILLCGGVFPGMD
jgi:hypothetical protein